MNKVIARYADGRMVKGMTADFFPNKNHFHMNIMDTPADTKPVEVNTEELKALFFVKSFHGDPLHVEHKDFDPARPPAGRRIRVVFQDGEILVGTTTGYQPGRPGFFLIPADPISNIERCFVISTATQEIGFI